MRNKTYSLTTMATNYFSIEFIYKNLMIENYVIYMRIKIVKYLYDN